MLLPSPFSFSRNWACRIYLPTCAYFMYTQTQTCAHISHQRASSSRNLGVIYAKTFFLTVCVCNSSILCVFKDFRFLKCHLLPPPIGISGCIDFIVKFFGPLLFHVCFEMFSMGFGVFKNRRRCFRQRIRVGKRLSPFKQPQQLGNF